MTGNSVLRKELQPAGNFYDKYGSRNPVARLLMNGFLQDFDSLVRLTGATDVHEVGCGEGHLAIRLAGSGVRVRACDVSCEIIEQARANSLGAGATVELKAASIFDLHPETDAAELVVCCEVLEHLDAPAKALQLLAALAKPYLLISVPREPLWRLLNLLRVKYLRRLGNTPGHINHWTKRRFLNLLDERFELMTVRSPLPWTMVLCRVRR